MPELSDEQRMHAAVELSAGRPGDRAESVRRRGTQRAITIRILSVLGALVVGVAVGLIFLSPQGTSRGGGPGRYEAVGVTLSVIGIVLVIGNLVRSIRTGRFRSGWRSPAFALTRRQRRSLNRQIRGSRPVELAQLPAGRQIALEMVRQGPQDLPMLGLVLITTGNALNSGVTLMWMLVIVVAVLSVGASIAGRRQLRAARRFLAAHPAPTPEPGS